MTNWGSMYDVATDPAPNAPRQASRPIYETDLGSAFCGDSLKVLKSRRLQQYKGQVQLVFTSPPFPLNTKKKYGNLKGKEYIKWFSGFAPLLREMVTDDGSIVIEIGNAWEARRPVMSTLVLQALLRFLERGGLNLCQEFVWYNPARLPSPVQWVNVERIRSQGRLHAHMVDVSHRPSEGRQPTSASRLQPEHEKADQDWTLQRWAQTIRPQHRQAENGGAKVFHGSGGMIPLRAA